MYEQSVLLKQAISLLLEILTSAVRKKNSKSYCIVGTEM